MEVIVFYFWFSRLRVVLAVEYYLGKKIKIKDLLFLFSRLPVVLTVGLSGQMDMQDSYLQQGLLKFILNIYTKVL